MEDGGADVRGHVRPVRLPAKPRSCANAQSPYGG